MPHGVALEVAQYKQPAQRQLQQQQKQQQLLPTTANSTGKLNTVLSRLPASCSSNLSHIAKALLSGSTLDHMLSIIVSVNT